MNNPRLYSFNAGNSGLWTIRTIRAVRGESLAPAARLDHREGTSEDPGVWSLRGVTSNERYVTNEEKAKLVAVQEGLGRTESMCAALIPIRKSPAWWALTQEQRRTIFEAQSQHTHIGMKYLPAIARRLHHCRDLATAEPFDFLTWFEYRPEDEPAFDDLLGTLRRSPEWEFVDREIDIRLAR